MPTMMAYVIKCEQDVDLSQITQEDDKALRVRDELGGDIFHCLIVT
jgi:hypothetical protein